MRLVKWRNPWAGEWGRLLSERVSGNEDGGTGREQGAGPDILLRARRARESKRLRRMRRCRYG
jgi:hypothetical protein